MKPGGVLVKQVCVYVYLRFGGGGVGLIKDMHPQQNREGVCLCVMTGVEGKCVSVCVRCAVATPVSSMLITLKGFSRRVNVILLSFNRVNTQPSLKGETLNLSITLSWGKKKQ